MKKLICLVGILLGFSCLKAQSPFMNAVLEIYENGGEISDEYAERYFSFAKKNADYPDLFKWVLEDVIPFNHSHLHLKFRMQDGVCQMHFLYIYDLNGVKMSNMKLAKECDRDGQSAIYHTYDSRLYAQEKIIEVFHKEYIVKDTSLHDGKTMYDGKGSSHEHEEIERNWYEYYELVNGYQFQRIALDTALKKHRRFPEASHHLLSREEVVRYNKSELRLMRNEIFADYGYIFKSEDLSDYFGRQSWYQGQERDVAKVAQQLSTVERINADLILQIEREM